MPHTVQRHFDDDAQALVGVPRFAMTGDRFHLEVAKLLLDRQQVTLTGLATALRNRPKQKIGLDRIIIAEAKVAPSDYYRAVADLYGLLFVDLSLDPPDFVMDELPAHLTAWRYHGDKLLLAAATLTQDDVEWADARFGERGYDFVIAVPNP